MIRMQTWSLKHECWNYLCFRRWTLSQLSTTIQSFIGQKWVRTSDLFALRQIYGHPNNGSQSSNFRSQQIINRKTWLSKENSISIWIRRLVHPGGFISGKHIKVNRVLSKILSYSCIPYIYIYIYCGWIKILHPPGIVEPETWDTETNGNQLSTGAEVLAPPDSSGSAYLLRPSSDQKRYSSWVLLPNPAGSFGGMYVCRCTEL